MPAFALSGTHALPGMPGASFTTGPVAGHLEICRWFNLGLFDLSEDIETYGVEEDAGPGRIKCVTFGTPDSAVIVDPRANDGSRELIGWVQEQARTLIMHNAPFDCPSLAINDLMPIEIVNKVEDTLIWARLATPGQTEPKDLDSIVERYLGISNAPITDLFKALGYRTKREGFLQLDIDAPSYLFGAAADAVATARVAPVVHRAAIDRQLNHPFGPRIGLSRAQAEVMASERQEHNRWGIESTIRGLATDRDYLTRFTAQNSQQITQSRAYLASLGITNGNHLMSFLDAIGAVPAGHRRTPVKVHPTTGRTTGGKLGATADEFQSIDHPLALMWAGREDSRGTTEVWGISQLEKLDGYLQKCITLADRHGRIHPTVAVLKAAHGRDSMAGVPLHQFPELARPIIAADPGRTWTSTDFSQQEPRIAMNLAGDIGQPLLDYERFGTKIYQGIADYADLTAKMAKVVVLAGLYGNGVAALSASLGLPPDPWLPERVVYGKVREAGWGYQAAKDVQAQVFDAIPATKRYMERGKSLAREHGLVWTVSGRIVPVPSSMFMGKYGVQAHKWINYNVSGSANDELSKVVVTGRRMGFGHLLHLGMHDELFHDTEVSREVKQLMETPSDRFCELSQRRPVIRTDQKLVGNRWDVA